MLGGKDLLAEEMSEIRDVIFWEGFSEVWNKVKCECRSEGWRDRVIIITEENKE